MGSIPVIARVTQRIPSYANELFILRFTDVGLDTAYPKISGEKVVSVERQYEVYEEGDSILPALALPNPCNVRIEITESQVSLYIGQRDWSWNRKTGNLIGCGTALDKPMPDEGPPKNIPI